MDEHTVTRTPVTRTRSEALSALKRKHTLTRAAARESLGDTVRGEIIWAQQDKCHLIPHPEALEWSAAQVGKWQGGCQGLGRGVMT